MSKYTTPTVQMLRADHRRLETAVANLHDTIGSHVEDLADLLEERADLQHRCWTLEQDGHTMEQLRQERDYLQAEVQRLRDENDELRAGRTTWPRGRGVAYQHAILPDGRVVSSHEAQHIKDGDPEAEAWEEGHSWGWSDAQEAHDVRQDMTREDWSLKTPNPYRDQEDQR